jgi:hypothetical protein
MFIVAEKRASSRARRNARARNPHFMSFGAKGIGGAAGKSRMGKINQA